MMGLIKHSFKISIVLFLIFFANIVIGKFSTSVFDQQLPLSLGGVAEFLLLALACLFFVIGILRSEAEKNLRP